MSSVFSGRSGILKLPALTEHFAYFPLWTLYGIPNYYTVDPRSGNLRHILEVSKDPPQRIYILLRTQKDPNLKFLRGIISCV